MESCKRLEGDASASFSANDVDYSDATNENSAYEATMESISSENMLYVGIAIALLTFTIVMFIQGWVMKLAVRLCGGDEIGVFYGVSTLTLSSLAGVAASTAVLLSTPDVSPWVPIVASLGGVIVVLCLMLRMGPLRALGVYVTQCLLSIFAVGATIAAAVAGVYFFVPEETLDELASNAKTQIANATPASFHGVEGADGQPLEVQNLAEISGILNFDFQSFVGAESDAEQSSDTGSVSLPGMDQLLDSDFVDAKQATGDDAKKGTSKRKPGVISPASEGDAKEPAMLQSPFDNKIRSNPFFGQP